MSALSARDVLAGALAVQRDLIRPEELAKTLADWLREPDRPLTEVLKARLGGAWDDVASEADQRLGSTPSGTEQSAGTDLPSVDWKPPPSPTRPTSAVGCRYLRLAEHARGGLGVVFRASDQELNRTVALKEIQERHADGAGGRARFVFEAEITGQLEHPGIVPVYGLGVYADGRPYYAMRFIHGESLEQAISRFHEADATKRDPAERSLSLRELLGRFVAVCNAVAYAHSRGVVHRDLKPANVMLGEYGETLVVDWGLAKRGKTAEVVEARSEEPAPPTGTAAGQFVGTAHYAPPEQALGEGVGPHSDVYSLGATLYELLSGKSPLDEPEDWKKFSVEERTLRILEKVVAGDVPPARQVNPIVPRPLEAVCQKAMSVEPARRYDSATALAEDVERWLADEPVKAYPDPLTVKARRWVARHRTLTASVCVGLLVALTAAGWIGWDAHDREQKRLAEELRQQQRLLIEQRERQREARQRFEDGIALEARAKASEPILAAALMAEALVHFSRAQTLLAADTDAEELQQRVEQKREALTRLEQDRQMVERLRLAKRGGVSGRGYVDPAKIRDGYREAFARYFRVQDVLSMPKEPAAQRIRASAYRADLIAALDDWWCMSPPAEGGDVAVQRTRAFELAEACDDDPPRKRLRAALYDRKLEALKEATREGPGKAWAALVTVVFRAPFPPDDADLINPPNSRHAMYAAFLEARLSELRAGAAPPTSAEHRHEVADYAFQFRELYHTAATLYLSVFEADPDVKERYRVRGARAAARAGTGQSQDAPADEAARARWRQLALEWLDQELNVNAALVFGRPTPQEKKEALEQQQRMAQIIRQLPDFAPLREKEGLAKLPEAEQAAWRSLWQKADEAARPKSPDDQ